MTFLALYVSLCGFTSAPQFRNAPPVLRDMPAAIRRVTPTEMPTIYVYPAQWRIEA